MTVLDGVRVLDLARYQAGPRCGMLLADLGADVIKVETPGGEVSRSLPPIVDGESLYFATYNRGKRSICVDLRSARGKSVFADLVTTADVVLENFRPGTMEKMGFGYEALRALRPDVIMASVSGFGQSGTQRERIALDPSGQALSGLMSLTGRAQGSPIGTASSVVDRYAALHATIGVLAALRHRDLTGEGQLVDVALMDAAYTMVEIPLGYYLRTGSEGGESGRPAYATADGHVVICPVSRDMDLRLAQIIGAPEPPRRDAASSATGAGPHESIVIEWCRQRTSDEVCADLDTAGIPVARVNTIPEAAADPLLLEREMLVEARGTTQHRVLVPGASFKLSRTPLRQGDVPRAGEHTVSVLDELGYTNQEIRDHVAAGVVGVDEVQS